MISKTIQWMYFYFVHRFYVTWPTKLYNPITQLSQRNRVCSSWQWANIANTGTWTNVQLNKFLLGPSERNVSVFNTRFHNELLIFYDDASDKYWDRNMDDSEKRASICIIENKSRFDVCTTQFHIICWNMFINTYISQLIVRRIKNDLCSTIFDGWSHKMPTKHFIPLRCPMSITYKSMSIQLMLFMSDNRRCAAGHNFLDNAQYSFHLNLISAVVDIILDKRTYFIPDDSNVQACNGP